MGSMSGVLSVIQICAIATALFYRPSHAAGQDFLQAVCEETEDPQFCLNVFNGDPRTPAADMAGLCLISSEITLDHVRETKGKIAELLGKINDPAVKKRMMACQTNYAAADSDFTFAWGSAANNAFPVVLTWARKGVGEAINCVDTYDRGSQSPLTDDNNEVIKLAGITFVTLKMLGVS